MTDNNNTEKLILFCEGFLNISKEKAIGCIEITAEKYNTSTDEVSEIIWNIIEQKRGKCTVHIKNKSLFDYQKSVVDTFYSNRGIIAAFATGTGKTLTAVTSATCVHMLANFFGKECNILVVTPASLVENMASEFKKSTYKFGNDLNVISSNVFRDTLLYNKKLKEGVDPKTDKFMRSVQKRGIEFSCNKNTFLIIDEAHEFKTDYLFVFTEMRRGDSDPNEVESRAKMFVEECYPHVWKILLLTATPMLNKWHDIMNLIASIKGVNPLAQQKKISIKNKEFPIDKTPLRDVLEREDPIPYEDITIVDSSYFKNVIVYKDIDVNNRDFPIRNPEIYIGVRMTMEFYQKIESLIQSLRSKRKSKKDRTSEQEEKELESLQKKIASIPGNSKIDVVKIMLERGNYDKIIIYSRFLDPLKNLKKSIDEDIDNGKIDYKTFIITGDTIAPNKRQKYMEDINSCSKCIIFISDAGGMGLDFKRIESVIIYEPGVNLSREEQAIGRAVRYKSHADLPPNRQEVDIYKLIMLYPESIVKSLKSKKSPHLSPDQLTLVRSQSKQLSSLSFTNKLNDLSSYPSSKINLNKYFGGGYVSYDPK